MRFRPVTAADGTLHEAAIHHRDTLAPVAEVAGPAVIEDKEATTYIDPGDVATVAANGALVIEW